MKLFAPLIHNTLYYIVFYILLLVFVVEFTSCKKCIVCSNVCYQCTNAGKTCSTDFPTIQAFDTILSSIEYMGDTCTLIQSTASYDICDRAETTKNFQTFFENTGYVCVNK
jgi:hypothetical protein